MFGVCVDWMISQSVGIGIPAKEVEGCCEREERGRTLMRLCSTLHIMVS